MNITAEILNKILSLPSSTSWSVGAPDGITLTRAQQLAIQPLLDNGVAEVIDVAAVKAEASRRILATMSIDKQMNALVRRDELMEIRSNGDTLTAEERAEGQAIKASWSAIKAIRDASNTIEAQPLPPSYLELIEMFDAALA